MDNEPPIEGSDESPIRPPPQVLPLPFLPRSVGQESPVVEDAQPVVDKVQTIRGVSFDGDREIGGSNSKDG